MSLYGCKMVLLHTLPQEFHKCLNRTLVIESSRVTLQFRGHLTLPTSLRWISNCGVIWNLRSTHEISRICQNWKMPSNGKFYKFLLPWHVRDCYRQSPACNALSSVKVGTLKTCNSNKSLFPFLSFGIVSPLRCSSLQIFYATNLRLTCLVSTPFKVFPCFDQFKSEKDGSCLSKFCYCNRNCESSVVLNNQNFEPVSSNNYT